MRWEVLLGDVEAEFDAAEQAAFAAEVEDRTRRELARLGLVDRFRATGTRSLTVALLAGGTVAGRVTGAGPDWLLLADDTDRELLVPLHAIGTVTGLGAAAAEPDQVGAVEGRLDLRYALRLLARSRAAVTVTLADAAVVAGTIERVGADWVDVSDDPTGDRRGGAGRVCAVPFSAISVIRPR
jgi:hypothetical protein